MRILQIHNAYRQRGGEDAVADAEAGLLSEAGHEVRRLIVTNPEGAAAAAGRLAFAAWNPASARLVRSALDDFRPDVAHVHNTWYSLTASSTAVLRAAGIPTVMTLHNYRFTCLNGQLLRDGSVCELCVGSSTMPGIRYRCYRNSWPSSAIASAGVASVRRRWARDVDRFIVMTEFARDMFVSSGLPAERFAVKPHHVPDPGARLDTPAASNRVLFVGRLAPEKGIDVLVEAWRKAELDGYELVVVGEGPLEATLTASATSSVRFTGWLDPAAVRQMMLSARLLAFPSIWYETFGLVMVEAMAAGTPVLASDLGGTPELVPDRGVLVPPGDAEAWAATLQARVPDDGWVDAAGRAVRHRYEDRFTPSHTIDALIAIYESAISNSISGR